MHAVSFPLQRRAGGRGSHALYVETPTFPVARDGGAGPLPVRAVEAADPAAQTFFLAGHTAEA